VSLFPSAVFLSAYFFDVLLPTFSRSSLATTFASLQAWAQALDDKQKAKESPRRRRHQARPQLAASHECFFPKPRQHLTLFLLLRSNIGLQISRLNKAVKLARQFQELVKESKRCTPRTQTEVQVGLSPFPSLQLAARRALLDVGKTYTASFSPQAYVKYMEGTLAFERKHWEQAAAALGDVKRIYHSLLPLVQSDTERSFYSQVCLSLLPPSSHPPTAPSSLDPLSPIPLTLLFHNCRHSDARRLTAASAFAPTISRAPTATFRISCR